MQNPHAVRRLFHLANRLSLNAELVRGVRKPHQLTPLRRRMLRHLKELNLILDEWSDHSPATRQKLRRPLIGPYDKLTRWDKPFRYR